MTREDACPALSGMGSWLERKKSPLAGMPHDYFLRFGLGASTVS